MRPTLFDEQPRTDSRPAGHLEDSFAFLNRIAGPYWDSLRDGLNRWYVNFPDHEGDLRQRFRSRSPQQHFAAWWELYLHRLFTGLDFDVEVHPTVAGASGRPDFAISRHEDFAYVEALTVFSGIDEPGRRGALEAEAKEAIDLVENGDFFVTLRFARVGASSPRRAAITRQVSEWLASLDADAVLERLSGAADLPNRRITVSDWELELQAIPVSPEFRGRPDHRVLGIGPVSAGYVNDVKQLGKALRRKRKAYGRPGAPLVLAALSLSPLMTDREVTAALFGSEAIRAPAAAPEQAELTRRSDGFWLEGGQPAGTRVSAVLLGVQVHPHNCAREWPRVWHHPWAAKPLEIDLPFPAARVGNGEVEMDGAVGLPCGPLRLSADWPGPHPAFARTAAANEG